MVRGYHYAMLAEMTHHLAVPMNHETRDEGHLYEG
jgi:hypothetical protein